MSKIVNCRNCQKEVKIGENEVYYLIRDNFKKYGHDCWCSNCLKAVQKICEEKWGVNKDCLFGEHDGEVLKYDPKSKRDFCCQWSICPWCEVGCMYILEPKLHLDHFYHFHGKDKGKCHKGTHKTEEEAKELENSGLREYKDVRKLYYVEGSPDVNDNRERERERERESKIEELRKRIEVLEAIVNRTPDQEQELQSKKKELAELEKQEQNPNQKSYWPWIIGGGIILILVIVIGYLLLRNKEEKSIK